MNTNTCVCEVRENDSYYEYETSDVFYLFLDFYKQIKFI